MHLSNSYSPIEFMMRTVFRRRCGFQRQTRSVGGFAGYALVFAWLIGGPSCSSLAGEPIRKEYELLLTIPRPIIEPMIPSQPGTIIIGRGGCRYLTAAVVTGDQPRADDAWKSIEATFAQ